MVPEAVIEQGDNGARPRGEGWFVLNARDSEWVHTDQLGSAVLFEGEPRFKELGINIQVLKPGQPNCMYHGEESEEDFLVLSGECLLLVEGEERPLKAWDFVHCPPNTEHAFVGAGDRPCVIFMTGAREGWPEMGTVYVRSELALRHGAGVETETTSGAEAYASFPKWQPGPPKSWDGLPWG
jgi:uncharacterized cupin superfamily protein